MFVGWGVSTARVKTMVKPTQTRRSSNGLAPTAAAGAQRSGTCVAGAFCFGRMHCCSDFNGTECCSKFHHCRFASSVLLLCVYMARVISRTKYHTVQLFRRRAAQSFVSFNRLRGLSPLVLYVAYLATTFSFHVFLTLISVAESWTIGAVSLMWMYRSPVQRYNLDLDDITLP